MPVRAGREAHRMGFGAFMRSRNHRGRRPGTHARPGRGDRHRHSRGCQGLAHLRLLPGRDPLPARHHPAGSTAAVAAKMSTARATYVPHTTVLGGPMRSLGANLGATRTNDFPARRTSADKRLAIMPGREPIRTMLNAIQVTTEQKAGCSNPSERAAKPQVRALALAVSEARISIPGTRRLTISHRPKRSCESWRAALPRRTYARSHAGPRRPLRTLRPETKAQA